MHRRLLRSPGGTPPGGLADGTLRASPTAHVADALWHSVTAACAHNRADAATRPSAPTRQAWVTRALMADATRQGGAQRLAAPFAAGCRASASGAAQGAVAGGRRWSPRM
ncbi:MAG: hypothetical protein R3A10_06285 [Caldilineaceae bacterium]